MRLFGRLVNVDCRRTKYTQYRKRWKKYSEMLLLAVSTLPALVYVCGNLSPVQRVEPYIILLVLEVFQLALWSLRMDLWNQIGWLLYHSCHLLTVLLMTFMQKNLKTFVAGNLMQETVVMLICLLVPYVILVFRGRGGRKKLLTICVAGILIFAYSFLWIRDVNVILDDGEAEGIMATVVDNEANIRKGVPYYRIKVGITQADGRYVTNWFEVSEQYYLKHKDKSCVELLAHPGAFGAAWYSVDDGKI